jgi:hypothetical protein
MCNPTLVAGVAIGTPNIQHYQLSSRQHVEFAICEHINSESAVFQEVQFYLTFYFFDWYFCYCLSFQFSFFKRHFRDSFRFKVFILLLLASFPYCDKEKHDYEVIFLCVCVCVCVRSCVFVLACTQTIVESLNWSLWRLACVLWHLRPSERHTAQIPRIGPTNMGVPQVIMIISLIITWISE